MRTTGDRGERHGEGASGDEVLTLLPSLALQVEQIPVFEAVGMRVHMDNRELLSP